MQRIPFSRGFSPSNDYAGLRPGSVQGAETRNTATERSDIHSLDKSRIMTRTMTKDASRASLFSALLGVVLSMATFTQTATAKSLYVIADKGIFGDWTNPVQAYDLGLGNTPVFQTQCNIPREMVGAIGMAIDSDAQCLFITYDTSNLIHIVDARTMTNLGTSEAVPAGCSNGWLCHRWSWPLPAH